MKRRNVLAAAAALALLVALGLCLPSMVLGDRARAFSAPLAAPVAGPGLYEDDSGYLTFDGHWDVDPSASQASGGEVRYSNIAGSSVILEFEGDRVTWITSNGTAEGVARVWIDGVYQPEADLYRPGARLWQVAIAYTVPPGRHQIKVAASNSHNFNSTGYNVTVDAFLVESGSSLQTPTPTATTSPTATAIPTATAAPLTVRVEAHLAFQRPRGHPRPQLPLHLLVYTAGAIGPPSPAALFDGVATTQLDGTVIFDLGAVPPGRYDLYAKGDHTLSRVVAGVSLVAGDTRVDFGLLPEGDVDGDDVVDSLDFDLLEQAFGAQTGEPGYSDVADLSGDEVVDISDLSLLAGNHGLDGAARAAMR